MSLALVWGVVAAILVITELFTGEFTCLSIAIGCLAASGASAAGVPLSIQLAAAFAFSVAALLVLAPWLRRLDKTKHTPDPVQAMVGLEAEVVEAIAPPSHGKVKLDGVVWQAECDRELAAGTRVMIAEVMGARLRVMGKAEFQPRMKGQLAQASEAERVSRQAIDETQGR